MSEPEIVEFRHQLTRIEESQNRMLRGMYGPDPREEGYSREARDKSINGRLEKVEDKVDKRTKMERVLAAIGMTVTGGFLIKLGEWLFLSPKH